MAAALDAFALDVKGMACVDLGCNVGGFTDCLLQRGAARVHAVDTAYGLLAWRLRQDDRVHVHERCNVLHTDPLDLPDTLPCDLATVDLGWTRQTLAVPAALRWLKPAPGTQIVSLIKPHYEASARGPTKTLLSVEEAEATCLQVIETLPGYGVNVLDQVRSPVRGGRRRKGNVEYLVLLQPRQGLP